MTIPSRSRDARGLTLVELMVGVALFGVVVVVMGPLLTSSFQSGRVVGNESRAVDEMRIAIARIDRELRSACEVSEPALDQSGSRLTFQTQIDSSGPYEVTYEVLGGRLHRITDEGASVVGDGLVVTSEEFTHIENNTGTRAQIGIDLQVRFEDASSPRTIRTTVAGRNTWSGCS